MALSVITPLLEAFDRTRSLLFKPFNLNFWFVLGFCAWLADLGSGGYSFNYQYRQQQQQMTFEQVIDQMKQGAHDAYENIITVVGVAGFVMLAAFIVLLILSLVILLLWLNSRGKFMFLDGVARRRGAVVEPWRRLRRLGNSLFWFQVVFRLVMFLTTVPVIIVTLYLTLPDFVAGGGVRIRSWS